MKTKPMKMTATLTAMIALAAVSPVLAEEAAEKHSEHMTHASPLAEVTELIAVIQPASGSQVKGSVVFEKVAGGVKITAKVGGFEPGTEHGFHIHELGDVSAADGTSTGGHYNPEGHDHGLPDVDERHAGDFGNLKADAEGNAEMTMTVTNLTLAGAKNPIIGRGVVIHANKDDGSQPTGNAGARIGVGVIGISKVMAKE